ncbi:helicase associated domain-containing protein [Streptomyces lavendulae]|uniref:helicase associated domain-containing protein n=2 Tax=Streptomyces lavendulae TaxID=1914 RepID=UPI0036E695B8
MTATPRLWQLGDEDEAGSPGELVASMDDDPDGPFGSRCFTLSLSEAIDRGICAPYQVVCVDVTDTQLQAAQLLGAESSSAEVRGARLAALQTALVKASAEEGFRRTLVFHHVVKEAEAFAAGLPDVAAQLHASDRELYPATIWADWLCGEHKPLHRRRVLAEFTEGIATDGTVVEKGYLGSVKVLGEGVDTKNCDSVYWADVRGSMPDLVQAVGRALRMHPGEGKVASLVVPILLGPGETADNMLTSRAYGGLAKLLEALRAHDARIVETLAEQQAPSRYKPVSDDGSGNGIGGGSEGVSAPAKALLKFSTPRDPAALAAFINLRVLNPEHEHWRRGVEAAVIYASAHGDLRVPFTFRVPAAEDAEKAGWPASLANFPLGQWTADARRFYTRGDMDEERVAQLEKLGMVWSHFDVAWAEGLSAARGWAAEHGHLLAPLDAAFQGAAVGIWLKNARVAARKAQEIEQRRVAGLPVESSAGAMPRSRREQLEEIDPSWCPVWPVPWQRGFHLVRQHLDTGQPLPTAAGEVVRQGEDDEMVLIGQYMANLRRTGAKNGLGKDQDTATTRAAQLTQIDNDWNCPWPLDWQRHHRILADLGDTEAGGVLPDITPGVLFDGDDIGRWLQQQKQPATWTRLLPEQQARLTALGVEPAQAPPPAPAAARAAKGPSKAQQAFQRGLAALTQWIEREGTHRPIPRAHSEQITVDGETEPVMVKLGVWVSNTKSRRDKLTQQHLDALRELGVDWA